MKKTKYLYQLLVYTSVTFGSLISSSVHSWVNLENGSLTLSYTISHDDRGKRPLKLELVYNQKSVDDSMVGIGWGGDFATKVEKPTPDGRVIIREVGNGAITAFVPQGGQLRVDDAITEIITAMGKKASSSALDQLRKQLKEDDVYRYAMAREFGVTMKVATGTVLTSNDLGGQTLTKSDTGWVRKKNSSETDYFNDKGQLVKSVFPDKYILDYEYKNDDLSVVKDSDNRQINLTSYPNHKIKTVETPLSGVLSTLTYKGNDLASIEIVGKEFKKKFDFKYDNAGVSNLVEVLSKEDGNQKFSYYPKNHWLKTHAPGNGTEVEYIYGGNPNGPSYWTQIITRRLTDSKTKPKDDKNLVIQDYKMTYEKKVDAATGKQWISKEIREEDGKKREISKNMDGLVTQIKSENRTVDFVWDGPRLMEKKADDGEFRKYEYDNKYKKLSKVTSPKDVVTFEYVGEDGLLQKAQNKNNVYVYLQYNKENLISTLTFTPKEEKEKITLQFEDYNAAAKPTHVYVVKNGKKLYNMNVTYLGGNYKEHTSNNEKEMVNYLGQGLNNLNGLIEYGKITTGSDFPSSERYGF